MSLHGLSRDAWKRIPTKGPGITKSSRQGLIQSDRHGGRTRTFATAKSRSILESTRAIRHACTQKGFGISRKLVPLSMQDDVRHAWHLYVIQLDLERLVSAGKNLLRRLTETDRLQCPFHSAPFASVLPQTWGYGRRLSRRHARVRPNGVSPVVFKNVGTEVYRTIEAVRELDYRVQAIMKRTIDLIGAVVGFLLTWPLWILAAILIKLDSAGPVFFTQIRMGRDRCPFLIFESRTMTADAPQGAAS